MTGTAQTLRTTFSNPSAQIFSYPRGTTLRLTAETGSGGRLELSYDGGPFFPWPNGDIGASSTSSYVLKERAVVRIVVLSGALVLDVDTPNENPTQSEGILNDILSDPEQLENLRDAASAGPRSTLVYAADNGAPGGTADDTYALTDFLSQLSDGQTPVLANRVYQVQPDALTWDLNGLMLGGGGGPKVLGSNPGTTIRLLADGGFGVKIGNIAGYPNLKTGGGIRGVKFHFGGMKFSDAAMVIENTTLFTFSGNMIFGVGSNTPGRYSRAMRLRAVWDSLFENNYFGQCWNPGASGLIVFDAVQTDANGNCNNLRWLSNHIEACDGTIFRSLSNSNLNECRWHFNKIEIGASVTGDPNNQYFFDLDQASGCDISRNYLNQAKSNKYRALVRFGASATSPDNTCTDNLLSAVTTQVAVLGPSARRTTIDRNQHSNAGQDLSFTNQSTAAQRYRRPMSAYTSGFSDNMLDRDHGWTSPHQLFTSNEVGFIPDTTTWAPEASVYRTLSAAGSPSITLVPSKLRDAPTGYRLDVMARRLSDSAASLNVYCGQADVLSSPAALAALPTALTGFAFAGSGTTVTGTKSFHGLPLGQTRVIISGTTSYNTPAGQPIEVTVADANTITFPSALTASESGSVQECPWQIISVYIGWGRLIRLGRNPADRLRVSTGSNNAAAFDIGGVRMIPCDNIIQSIPYAASATPNLSYGNDVTVGTLTGNITVNNPSNVPPVGHVVSFSFVQDATGSRTLAWGNQFKGSWPTAAGAANQKVTVTGKYDGTNYVFVSSSGWYS